MSHEHKHENLIISLMEARKKGKTIQFDSSDGDGWADMHSSDFEFPKDFKYRIKPDEPCEFLLAKYKHDRDEARFYWHVTEGKECGVGEFSYDYIRVREILED